MAQLRLAYPDIERRQADLVQITHNTLDEARKYFKWYPMAFPYLCDPDRAAHERYGLALEPISPLNVMKNMAAAAGDLVLHGERTPSPLPFARRYLGHDSPQAMFVVDRDGIVRNVFTMGPNDRLPSQGDLVRSLDALSG